MSAPSPRADTATRSPSASAAISRSELRCMGPASVRGRERLGLFERDRDPVKGQTAFPRLGDQELEAARRIAAPDPLTNGEMMAVFRKVCGVPIGLPAAKAGSGVAPGARSPPTGTIAWPPHSSDTPALAARTTTISVSQTWLAHRLPGLRSIYPLTLIVALCPPRSSGPRRSRTLVYRHCRPAGNFGPWRRLHCACLGGRPHGPAGSLGTLGLPMGSVGPVGPPVRLGRDLLGCHATLQQSSPHGSHHPELAGQVGVAQPG